MEYGRVGKATDNNKVRRMHFAWRITMDTYCMDQSPSWEANQFAANQEIHRNFMEPEGSLQYSQVPATCPYPEPTPSSPHNPLQNHGHTPKILNTYCFLRQQQ
jgi:hypothetical protein